MTEPRTRGGSEPAPSAKRERLVEAAKIELLRRGVQRTTIADVAEAAGVPLGNVYYYFKTKDSLIAEVIKTYGRSYANLIESLERRRTPRTRLRALVGLLTGMSSALAEHGCPIGSLAYELGKRGDPLRPAAASVLFQLIEWAEAEFREIGRSDARQLAVALIASYQGIVLLANVLAEPELIDAEAHRLERWIDEIADPAAASRE